MIVAPNLSIVQPAIGRGAARSIGAETFVRRRRQSQHHTLRRQFPPCLPAPYADDPSALSIHRKLDVEQARR
jgi:hypothetical protein